MSTTNPPVPPTYSIVAGGSAFRGRYLKDTSAKWVVWVGGLGVIAALLLIFFYLVSEVVPLFAAPKVVPHTPLAQTIPALYAAVEEQGEIALLAPASGELQFIALASGKPIKTVALPLAGRSITAISEINPEQGQLAAALSDGSVLAFAHSYTQEFPDGKRVITPEISYPVGELATPFLPGPARSISVRRSDSGQFFAGLDAQGALFYKRLSTNSNPITGETTTETSSEGPLAPASRFNEVLVAPGMDYLYALDQAQGKLAFFALNGDAPQLLETITLGAPARHLQMLAGGISIVLALDNGKITQLFPARKPGTDDIYLATVRSFQLPKGKQASAIAAEMRRRTFAVGDTQGGITLFHATAERKLSHWQAAKGPIQFMAFNPRAQSMVALADQQLLRYDVHNEHPEFSLKSLWGKVWYESYEQPEWLWQSSSASSDFEAKFSFTPLAFGTLKAAFYAMIFAVPIALMAAIFVANFMSPELRQVVKPTVELLAALPSVILGFLAGLWLAPFVESNLPGIFLLLVLLPLSIPLFGYIWLNLPQKIRQLLPAGYEGALLIPVIMLVVWFCFTVAKPIEAVAFGGNMQNWMDHTLGIKYVQRNALVVGIAMGVAVIPTIFSIAEDAIFSVPKQLSLGSLALGASPWQTLVGVVLPTASPGIFSAMMIGLGRAVGETMIVLMATGNTAVTDSSIFSGMRTLSANVAVEMPESEVGSTHFRLLFLAGLVLFVFTFFFNTLAEVVRTRLRKKYASI